MNVVALLIAMTYHPWLDVMPTPVMSWPIVRPAVLLTVSKLAVPAVTVVVPAILPVPRLARFSVPWSTTVPPV